MNQLMIFVCSVTAVGLVTNGRRWGQKWGSLVGLAGQPFWFWDTWHAQQWGMFGGTILFTLLYLRAFIREIRTP